MKPFTTISSVIILAACIISLTLIASDKGMTYDEKKQPQWTELMGRPIINESAEGLHLKVWLITQKAHAKMMKGKMGHMMIGGMKDTSGMKDVKGEPIKLDKATMDAVMGGTHLLMVFAADAATGNEFIAPTSQLKFISPSAKETSIDLPLVMGHFAEGITLSEKGTYRFFLDVTANGFCREKQFTFTVK